MLHVKAGTPTLKKGLPEVDENDGDDRRRGWFELSCHWVLRLNITGMHRMGLLHDLAEE